jgi:predicted transcriptional regulator
MKVERIHPGGGLAVAMNSPTVLQLSPLELVVYLRLVAMSDQHIDIYPTNAEIYRDTAAVKAAIRSLEEHRLIRVKRDPKLRATSKSGRQITVLR